MTLFCFFFKHGFFLIGLEGIVANGKMRERENARNIRDRGLREISEIVGREKYQRQWDERNIRDSGTREISETVGREKYQRQWDERNIRNSGTSKISERVALSLIVFPLYSTHQCRRLCLCSDTAIMDINGK